MSKYIMRFGGWVSLLKTHLILYLCFERMNHPPISSATLPAPHLASLARCGIYPTRAERTRPEPNPPPTARAITTGYRQRMNRVHSSTTGGTRLPAKQRGRGGWGRVEDNGWMASSFNPCLFPPDSSSRAEPLYTFQPAHIDYLDIQLLTWHGQAVGIYFTRLTNFRLLLAVRPPLSLPPFLLVARHIRQTGRQTDGRVILFFFFLSLSNSATGCDVLVFSGARVAVCDKDVVCPMVAGWCCGLVGLIASASHTSPGPPECRDSWDAACSYVAGLGVQTCQGLRWMVVVVTPSRLTAPPHYYLLGAAFVEQVGKSSDEDLCAHR
ncbi:hypothetical protein F4859DRAFT_458143 [Xylaria cf. heliscus]|nr:hypothetical protein F4859DRAFT_458143 [Xylaria cf. heliscus]